MNPQQPPYGQQAPYGGYPPQAPPAGAPGQHPPAQPYAGYGYGQQPPTGQPPYHQSYPGGPPAPQAPGQYPPPSQQQQHQQQQYQGQAYPPYGAPPPGHPASYGQPPPASGQYGQQPPPGQYGHQPPYQQPPYGAPPPGQHWQQPPPHQTPGQQPFAYGGGPPTPASLGYDSAQKQTVPPVDTSSDVEALRKAMKGMGCDERALIRVFADRKYQNPWVMAQLVRDYNSRFLRDLANDIKGETRGTFETALLALLRGPLENDVYTLDKALDRAGTDEEALMDVLLCRSNADIRAIVAWYRGYKGRELLADIKDDVDDTLFRLYSMVLAAARAEDSVPVNPAEIDHKITELQRATEGTIGANAIAVAQIFTSTNDAQLRAMSDAYQRKYHRSLEDVIEREFRGDMEDALLRMLANAKDRARLDAQGLREPLMKTLSKDKLFINRALRLHWDRNRLAAAQMAYKKLYGQTLTKGTKELLSGDYEDLMVALIGDKP